MSKKKEALRDILSPEQFKIYEGHIDRQAEMAKRMLKQLGENPAGQ